MANITYAVYRDGKLLADNLTSEIKAMHFVHNRTSCSFGWALLYEGYSVIGTDHDTGKTWKLKGY